MQAYQTLQNKLNKKYSKIPCDRCKGHHIKCDKRFSGCKNCSRRGISCTYLITRKRRGPKTKSESMIKLLESLNITNQITAAVEENTTDSVIRNTPNISTDKENNQNLELKSLVVSSSIQTIPLFSNSFAMPQIVPIDLSIVYQDIYSLQTLVMNNYNIPLPPLTNTINFDPSFTIPAPCNYSSWHPQLEQFQQIEGLYRVPSYYNAQNYPLSTYTPFLY